MDPISKPLRYFQRAQRLESRGLFLRAYLLYIAAGAIKSAAQVSAKSIQRGLRGA